MTYRFNKMPLSQGALEAIDKALKDDLVKRNWPKLNEIPTQQGIIESMNPRKFKPLTLNDFYRAINKTYKK